MKARMVPVLAALVLSAIVAPASAHKASDAYLNWEVQGAVVQQRIDIALRDLDRDLVLDADDDGQLSWGEVRSRWDDINRLAQDAVQVSAQGQRCTTVATQSPQLDSHVDGRYAVLRSTLRCAVAVRQLDIDYRLFAASDPTHRGLARVQVAAASGAEVGSEAEGEAAAITAVLVPGAGPQALAFVAAPAPADGQAAVQQQAPRGFLGFVQAGAEHIAQGLDHLLFLATLLVVAVWRREGRGWVPRASAASAWREALKLVTAFTAAHTLTLGLAAAGVLAPPTRWVETLIAASVLLAALDNLWPLLPGPRWPIVSAFGLVHGFGFAGPLQDLGLQGGNLVGPLLGFNLGVEAGQLALIALLLPLACLWRQTRTYDLAVVRVGSAAVALLALVWTLERGLGGLPWA